MKCENSLFYDANKTALHIYTSWFNNHSNKLNFGFTLKCQDNLLDPDPDPDTSVLKIFHLFYDKFS